VNKARGPEFRLGRTMPLRISRDNRPSTSAPLALVAGSRRRDRPSTIDNQNRRAVLGTVDERAEMVLSFGNSDFFHEGVYRLIKWASQACSFLARLPRVVFRRLPR
jgi:hypothetical protein